MRMARSWPQFVADDDDLRDRRAATAVQAAIVSRWRRDYRNQRPELRKAGSMEPVRVVILRSPAGREYAQVIVGPLPERLTRKVDRFEDPPIVWRHRLDLLPPKQRDFWLRQTTATIYRTYAALRDAGKLPPDNEPRPSAKSSGGPKTLSERWEPPAKTWDDRAPAQHHAIWDRMLDNERRVPRRVPKAAHG